MPDSNNSQSIQNSTSKNPSFFTGISHGFDTGIAEKCGVNAAIVYSHFGYWVKHNEITKKNIINGKAWIFETYETMRKYLPYLSVDQLRTAIEKLVDQGLIIKDNFNKNRFDQTKWYTISNNSYVDEKSQIDLGQIEEPVPNREWENPKSDPGLIPNGHISSKKEGKKIKDIAQTTPLLRQEIIFSFESSSFLNISNDDLESWRIAYPASTLNLELERMKQWCLSNPSRSKNKSNWRKFITSWLQKNNDELTNKQAYQQNKTNSVNRRTKNTDGTYVTSPADGLF